MDGCTNKEDHEFMTTGDVADRLRVTERTVRNWIIGGRISGIKTGPREWRIPAWEFERFLRSGRW